MQGGGVKKPVSGVSVLPVSVLTDNVPAAPLSVPISRPVSGGEVGGAGGVGVKVGRGDPDGESLSFLRQKEAELKLRRERERQAGKENVSAVIPAESKDSTFTVTPRDITTDVLHVVSPPSVAPKERAAVKSVETPTADFKIEPPSVSKPLLHTKSLETAVSSVLKTGDVTVPSVVSPTPPPPCSSPLSLSPRPSLLSMCLNSTSPSAAHPLTCPLRLCSDESRSSMNRLPTAKPWRLTWPK